MAESLYQKIENDIKKKILDGTYELGFRLMSELEMTEFYKVSRITVRKAMINLANSGLIERTRGKGTHVLYDMKLTESNTSDQLYGKIISVIVPVLDVVHTKEIFSNIYKHATTAGYSIIIHQTFHNQELEEKYVKQSVEMNVAGIIVYPAQNEKYNEEIIKLVLDRFPIVLIDRTLDGINVNSVVTNNEKAAYDATKYLIELGHTHIGLASSPINYAKPLIMRQNGYRKALREAGIKQNVRFVCVDLHDNYDLNLFRNPEFYADRIKLVDDFIKENPSMTAIFCLEPIEGAIVMEVARKLQIKVPEDLSIISFDDYTMSNFFSVPPTVVKQNSEEIGKIAFEILHDKMLGNNHDCKHIFIEAELIIRKSTCPPENCLLD